MSFSRLFYPSITGEEGGKKIGERVSHYIQPGGRFEKACNALIVAVLQCLGSRSPAPGKSWSAKGSVYIKKKYNFKFYSLATWGKPEIKGGCGECRIGLEAEIPEEGTQDIVGGCWSSAFWLQIGVSVIHRRMRLIS
jgi:hypothetical protein